MRKPAHLAVAARGALEIQRGKGVRLRRACAHTRLPEQMLAHQMRQLAAHAANPQVDTGLAEMDGLELRVAIRHVQERHGAKARQVVQALRGGRGIRF